eukprot:CAMPEP_0171255518 /NCGR_PEP_ID=MMETSP0790-20130122/52810_1 /TAXON_ID=2925 /ORGANISM="Alexandrium catenella, Strain OF101" /LENGTH=565 /DNA_ID=CAMNT_0011723477 /DNA_START=145 /DNA_END=1838 /DNA_ORIENTATION=-
MAGLDVELVKLQAADAAAANMRSSEAALYASADTDYTSTIAAIEQALAALEAAESSTDSLLLAQRKVQQALVLSEARATEEQRQVLTAFVQEGATSTPRPSLKSQGDYNKHVKKYAFKSNSVIEMLKELKLKFEDEKLATTKGETNAINAYQLAKAARADLTGKATASKSVKATELSDAQAARIQAEGSLNTTQDDLTADAATLAQTTKACAVKRSEWAQRSETRAKELEAMKAAIDILSKATGVRTEAPQNPVPPPSPVSLLELGSADPKMKAVELLRASAQATHSHALERLAQEITAHLSGPFDAVNNMVQKMIFHLMDEQRDEDKHKNWCDLELNKTDISKLDKEGRMAELKAKIDDAQATVQLLTNEIAAADKMAQTIAEHMNEAAEIRTTGKAENKEAVRDAQDAQTALSSAIAVLEAFYKDSGMVKKEAWELLQRAPVALPTDPATWGSSYTGTTDPMAQPAGIIAVLKKVSAEFASMEAQTLAQEESDQNIFEEDRKLNEIEKARRIKESEVKDQEKKRLVGKTASMTASRKHVSDEKEAVEQYFKDLQHACVDGDST